MQPFCAARLKARNSMRGHGLDAGAVRDDSARVIADSGRRPALDGIRAFAVLAVVAYHLGFRSLPGGFLGVDLFFVLSGYLITGLLLSEHARTGRVDLRAFWLRRAKRLLPALFVVLAAVAIWTSENSSPFEFGLRRSDLLWTLFYGSNWHFIASGQDYFAQFAAASPVRHTWSLAIEEQFYLAWPLVIVAGLWLGRGRPAWIAVACVLGTLGSVAVMAVVYDPGDPSRAYYGTDARLHQLLIGALLAVAIRTENGATTRFAPHVALLAAASLALAMALLPEQGPAYYLGGSAFLATAGAALVWGLERAPSAPFARALSWRPVAWIGRISYGLYLWHWPVILAISAVPEPLATVPMGLDVTRVALTFGLAAASFYLLEEPIRTGRMPVIQRSPRRFVLGAAASAALLVATSVWATSAPVSEVVGLPEIPGCEPDTICLRQQGPEGAPVVALVGDSIARSLDPGFLELAEGHQWTYLLAAPNGCRLTGLLTSYDGVARPMDRECLKIVPRLHGDLLEQWHPDLIIAIDRWEIIDAFGPDGEVVESGTAEHLALTETAMENAARRLTAQGARLVFIELPPILPAACTKPATQPVSNCARSVAADVTDAPYNAIFRRVAALLGGSGATISITDLICPGGICVPEVSGRIVRFDGLHFTPAAGRWLAPAIYKRLAAQDALP
jgi:peptidoglycan/LPS O-acetylase OafA/YrhL